MSDKQSNGHDLGEEDPTPPGPTIPPEVRDTVLAIDNLTVAFNFFGHQLAQLRAEVIANPDRNQPYFQERIADAAEGLASNILGQVQAIRQRARRRG